jgi:hypothetical protein
MLASAAAASLLCVFTLPAVVYAAPRVNIEAKFTPVTGVISDATLLSSGRVGLCYPDAGFFAEYTLDGRLFQHTVREAGIELPFRPVCCAAGPADDVLIFDEAEGKLFEVEPDGNFNEGVKLAFKVPGSANSIALPTVGDICWQAKVVNNVALPPSKGYLVWAMLPERGELACFNSAGAQISAMAFNSLLPYEDAIYTRAQFAADGSLFVMDYLQGAVIYRRGGESQFRRLRPVPLDKASGAEAAPQLQDFAVDSAGIILAASTDSAKPLLLLTPGKQGYDSRKVDLGLPKGEHRIGVRYGRGKFIVWLRDTPLVCVLRLQ